MLKQIDEDIWIVEGGCVNFFGFAYPTRCVVVRLSGSDLWVWSPIKLSQELKLQIDQIGHPKFLVSPNKLHHLFLAEWSSAFPQATVWGPQSTIAKCKELSFETPLDDTVPDLWAEHLDQAWFNGSFAMDEVVFFHHPSRTAILADLSENFSEKFLLHNWPKWQRVGAHLWGIVEGKGYAPLEWRLSFLNRSASRRARDKVLSWNPERVVMAHGEWQPQNGRAFLEKSFSWMGD